MSPDSLVPELGTLCLRADAGPTMGAGHLMRCLALAQSWLSQGGQALLLTARATPLPLRQRMEQEGLAVHLLEAAPATIADAEETTAVAAKAHAQWIALDGYHFTPDYQHALGSKFPLLWLEDTAAQEHPAAAILLNQNLHAHAALYDRKCRDTQLLLGPRFALLRREFQQLTPPSSRPEHLLITLGGSDPNNISAAIIRALAASPTPLPPVRLVIGAANPHRESLVQLAQSLAPQLAVEWIVAPPDMAALMAEASLAISAAGSTCWELACLGLPMILVVIADNQQPIAAELAQRGAALAVGQVDEGFAARLQTVVSQLLAQPNERASLARAARQIVDGRGARRVVERLRCYPVQYRPVELSDAKLLWEWANDPTVRSASFDSRPIPWEDHQAWLARKLASATSHLFIGLKDALPIGLVRFEASPDQSMEIGINLAPCARGSGWGWKLIRLASFNMLDLGGKEVVAWIKPLNTASQRAFLKAGFRPSHRSHPAGHEAEALVLRRELEGFGELT